MRNESDLEVKCLARKGDVMSQPLANALLGYPDDARLLIINADEFRMCHFQYESDLFNRCLEGVGDVKQA